MINNIFKISIVLFCMSLVYSCDLLEDDKEQESYKVSRRSDNDSKYEHKSRRDSAAEAASQPIDLTIDTLSTDIANFVAGINSDNQFNYLQRKKFYKSHTKIVEEAWKKNSDDALLQINRWVKDNNITDPRDTLTLLYPFSGPDILHANAFFPYCRNYIMIGLEKPGNLPDLNNLHDTTLDHYLESVRYSLRYIQDKGYFVTSHMKKDFSEKNLDGVIHIMLYFLARTNKSILNVAPIYIDNFGNVAELKEGEKTNYIDGLKIDFCSNDKSKPQTIYYFRFNLKDDKFRKNLEFMTFLSRFNEKITYVKSGSYILHNSEFSMIRNLILEQSKKILQDDTGIPFRYLNTKDYDLNLFGYYTKTIKDFKYNFQPDLKAALDKQKEAKPLPFKIGYNAWYNETVLLYARFKEYNQDALAENKNVAKKDTTKIVVDKVSKKDKSKETTTDVAKASTKGLTYKVQIKTSSKKLKLTAKEFKGFKDVSYYETSGKIKYKYTIGNKATIPEAIKLQKQALGAGFKDAFVVAFYNNKRISIKEAKQLAKNL